MIDLTQLQNEVGAWSRKNFGDQPAYRPLLGVAEETGELCHAFLKKEQNIRLEENHDAKLKDAVGDIVIYLADFCERTGINLDQCIYDAWSLVQEREWKTATKLDSTTIQQNS